MKSTRFIGGVAALLSVAFIPVPARAGEILFAAPVSYDLEFPEPRAIATSDFDNDGQVDIAAATRGSWEHFDGASISVLLGNGLGSFTDAGAIEETRHINGLAAADFDGDGNADIAYLRDDPGELLLALGDGTGTFAAAAPIAATGAWLLATADFNGDGNADLVTSDQLEFFAGRGDGSFEAPQTTPNGVQVHDLVVADMDLDQMPDLVLTTPQGWVLVYLGDGTGHFAVAGTAGGGFSFVQWNHVAVGDLNGDAYPDVAWVMDYPYALKAALGGPGGTLGGERQLDSYGISPYDVTIGDLDQDGRGDLAVTARWTTVWVYAGTGDGDFAAAQYFATELEPELCAALDLTADAKPELLVACRNAGDTPRFAVHLNQSEVTQTAVPGAGPLALALGPAAPNPFSARTSFALALPAAAAVSMSIVDVQGRLVRSLLEGALSAGSHALHWDGRDAQGQAAPAGVYFVRANIGGEVTSRSLVRLR